MRALRKDRCLSLFQRENLNVCMIGFIVWDPDGPLIGPSLTACLDLRRAGSLYLLFTVLILSYSVFKLARFSLHVIRVRKRT